MSEAQGRRGALRLAAIRIGIGFAQGLALYALDRWGAGLMRPAFAGLQLLAMLGPLAALASIGALRGRWLWTWLGASAAVFLGLGAYDGFIGWNTYREDAEGMWPRPEVIASAAVSAFIAYQLTLAAARAGGVKGAPYDAYFDEAWKDGVRLGLGGAFVGAMWIVLLLGSALFDLIGLKTISELVRKPWFAFPATTTFFAISAHITDTRAGLVQGARTLGLTLLSWLMPLMTLIAVGFVVALLFTGLKPLWGTGHAGAILLAATAALIVLINATYQDGEREGFPPTVLKWAVRVAAVLLTPLTLIAAYGVWLRIGQYGLTPERIYSLACLAVAAVYAGGYLWACASRGPWMTRLERVNVVGAYLAVAIVLAIFSPLIDPARLSVASQVARLERGADKAEAFDFQFLHWETGRWGRQALKQMAQGPAGMIKAKAEAEQASNNHYRGKALKSPEGPREFEAFNGALPASFLTQSWTASEDPAQICDGKCLALTVDVNSDGKAEVAVFGKVLSNVYAEQGGRWRTVGSYGHLGCGIGELRAAMKEGPIGFSRRTVTDIRVGQMRYVFAPENRCWNVGDGPSPDFLDLGRAP